MIDPSVKSQQEILPTVESARQSGFVGDVLKLVSGTTAVQIISVLASPVLARLFDPDAFGVFALFSSIVGILAAVFTLEYELAIMLPKDDSDAANIVTGSLGIASLFSLLTVPIIWLGGPTISVWLNAPELAPYLWFVPLLLFFGGIGAGHPVLDSWASRTRRFAQISITRVASTLTSTLAKLAAGFVGFNSGYGLIGGSLVGSILSPLLLGWQIWKRDGKLFLQSIHWQGIYQNLKKYHKFAVYNTPSALLNSISWQAPSLLLAAFFSPTIVGFYALGNQLLRIPMSLIGGSIAQAFYSHAAVANRDGSLARFAEGTFRRLVNYSFFPMLMLTVMGKEIFTVIFGTEWTEAGVYIQILSLWMIFWFISSPMSRLYSVLEKNELALRLNTVILITRLLSIWLGGIMNSPRLALLFFSISGALTYGYLSFTIISFAGVAWRQIGGILLENFFIFVPAGVVIFILKLINVPDWLQVVSATFLLGVYFIYRAKNEPSLQRYILNKKDTAKTSKL